MKFDKDAEYFKILFVYISVLICIKEFHDFIKHPLTIFTTSQKKCFNLNIIVYISIVFEFEKNKNALNNKKI